MYGNIGVTLLSVVVGLIGLFLDFKPIVSLTLIVVLTIFMIMDIIAYREPKKLGKLWEATDFVETKDKNLSTP